MKIAGSVDVGDGSGVRSTPDPAPTVAGSGYPHHQLRHSKSLTSRGPRALWALDPIQRLPWIPLEGIQVPGRNDRRYGNAMAAWRPWLLPTRIPRGLLSPEARSCAARGGGGGGVHRSVYGRVVYPGGVPPGYPTMPVHGPGYTPTLAPRAPQEWASGLNGPRGARRMREYTGIPGIHGNTGIPGIHGNTGNTRDPGNTREHREYTGIP